jgi:hypothetical protein
MQWMNTRVAVEQIAGMCSELPVFLDDAQHCPDDLKRAVVYMIANGKGKGRGAKGAASGRRLRGTRWRSHIRRALARVEPPRRRTWRILPVGGAIPPFRPGTGAFVQSLERAITVNHGHAGEAFIKHINGWSDFDWYEWQRRYTRMRTELLRGSSSDLVGRVSGYIAAIHLRGRCMPASGAAVQARCRRGVADVPHRGAAVGSKSCPARPSRTCGSLRLEPYNFAGDGRYEESEKRELCTVPLRNTFYVASCVAPSRHSSARKWNATAVLNKMGRSSDTSRG